MAHIEFIDPGLLNQGSLFPLRTEYVKPLEPIVRTAEFSECGRLRWTLKRAWGSGPHIAWIGLNPSIADHRKDDPTVWREMCFSCRWGFGSMVKLNLYPFVSSKPSELWKWLEGDSVNDGMSANFKRTYEELKKAEFWMAAWGTGKQNSSRGPYDNIADWHDDMNACMELEELPQRPLHCLGTTADGSPVHTLARGKHRVPDNQKPIIWREA